jgi:membrane-associated HD superfamily phosphohydrolase
MDIFECKTIDAYGRSADWQETKQFRHCCFKGGGSTTVNNTSTYTPTKYELQLQNAQAKYANAISPNSLWLNDTARKILQNSIGAVQVNFNGLNNKAQSQLNAANQGYNNLANGELPSAYTKNMADAIRTGVQDTYGNLLNQSATRGVLNSSVTSKALDDISKNVSDTMAQNFTNNVNTLSNIYGNQINAATSGITTAAAAQEAAQQPALNLWNASLGLNGATTGALAAAAGKGTTQSTSQQSTSGGGGGLFSGLLGGLF